jgi:hypothetical protein
VNWDVKTFQRLMVAPPERLVSRFQITHCDAAQCAQPRRTTAAARCGKLIRDCHDTPRQKQQHTKRAWQLFRSLVERRIVEFWKPVAVLNEEGVQPGAAGEKHTSTLQESTAATSARKVRVNVELQDDFSLDQTLSLYLLDTIPLVNPEQEDYALVLLTLVESIVENPEAILRRQLDRVKGQAVAAMKAEGIDYEARMAKLDELEYPKPNREFIYSTFNAFADKHPWVGQENIRPKSIAREMFETFRSFRDYIRDYELQRVEGLLLRHLNSVYKVLKQTVPDAAKNEAVREMELYLGTLIRAVDSSLLDEWEKMRDPDYERRLAAERSRDAGSKLRPPGADEAAADITRDTQGFTASIRNRIFTFLRGLVIEEYETALAGLDLAAADSDGNAWTPDRLKAATEAYYASHGQLLLTPEARNRRHTYVTPAEDKLSWRVQQMLVDPEGHNDWVAEFAVDLPVSRERGALVMGLVRLGSLA